MLVLNSGSKSDTKYSTLKGAVTTAYAADYDILFIVGIIWYLIYITDWLLGINLKEE